MSLTTIPVRVLAERPDGSTVAGARVRAVLTVPEVDVGLVVPSVVEQLTDNSGVATLQLWPNARGVNASQYRVIIENENYAVLITVPDAPADTWPLAIKPLINQPPYPSASAGQQAAADAQAARDLAKAWATRLGAAVEAGYYSAKEWAVGVFTRGTVGGGSSKDWATYIGGTVDNAEFSAKAYANASGASAAAAVISEGNALNSKNAARTSELNAATSAGTAATQAGIATAQNVQAANQANISKAYADSAGSVVQQDLSGTVGTLVHMPTVLTTAMCFYDVANDSDPDWPDRMAHAAWANEPLCGAWLGSYANEAAARAAPGAATGAYFRRTSDARFYKLVAVAGITEVLRGNEPKWPAQTMIVAEIASGTVGVARAVAYDLTKPGQPMWGVICKIPSFGSSVASCIAALNGKIFVGVSAGYGGYAVLDLLKSSLTWDGFGQGGNGKGVYKRENFTFADQAKFISTDATTYDTYIPGFSRLTSEFVNSAAMTVLNDAPVDQVTGMQVPTIVVGTTLGANIIRHNGVIEATVTNASVQKVYIDRGWITAVLASGNFITGWPLSEALPAGGASGLQTYWKSDKQRAYNSGTMRPLGQVTAGAPGGRYGGASGVTLYRENFYAYVTNTYNTLWMRGDIRRAYLLSTVAGNITATELVANGTFNVNTAGWITSAATISVVSGALRLTATGPGPITANTVPMPTVAGKTYEVSIKVNASPGKNIFLYVGSAQGGSNLMNFTLGPLGATGTYKSTFVAVSGTSFISVSGSSVWVATEFCDVDDVSCVEVIADRSCSGAAATIVGSLTTTPVAPGAQLVAYSGWSAANYIQEPYSPAKDYGTSEWHLSAKASQPAVLPPANYPATHLTAGDRFNTADWTKGTGWSASSATVLVCDGSQVANSDCSNVVLGAPAAGTVNRWGIIVSAISGTLSVFANNGTVQAINAPGTYYGTGAISTSVIRMSAGGTCSLTLSVENHTPVIAAERSAATGPFMKLGALVDGRLVGIASDGTTTRVVTSATAYNTASIHDIELKYLAGRLWLEVGGKDVGFSNGAPLLTMNNATATFTMGNSRDLNAAWPGALLDIKTGATVGTTEQAIWMADRAMAAMQPGAQVTLAAATTVLDMTADKSVGRWSALQAGAESIFSGLVRVATDVPSSGTLSMAAAVSGMRALARITVNAGVYLTLPALNLREQLIKRARATARSVNPVTPIDRNTVGFTATTATASKQLTAVASVLGTPYVGMGITGTGIPAGAVIEGINGTTYTLSIAATANGTTIAIGQNTFTMPAGLTVVDALLSGVAKQEGPTKDFTRSNDGMEETIVFASSPGSGTWARFCVRRDAT